MSTTKPGIVIVPGGMHVPSHYTLLRDSLTHAGYSVLTSNIPSNGGPEPLLGISQDIDAVQQDIKSFIEKDIDVLMVMHSMGGIWGSEAAKGLRPQDQRNGKGIIGLVYLASFPPDAGVSAVAANGGALSPWATIVGDPSPTTRFWLKGGDVARDIFYNDCTPKVADDAMSKLVLFSGSGCYHECTYPAWKEIESNYLICELDHAIPPEGQVMMASQPGGRWKFVETIQSGHSPFLSKPKETALFIRKCAGENM